MRQEQKLQQEIDQIETLVRAFVKVESLKRTVKATRYARRLYGLHRDMKRHILELCRHAIYLNARHKLKKDMSRIANIQEDIRK